VTDGAPRYVALAKLIRNAIEEGKFQDQEALPSERELASLYGVSRETVRKAIQVMRSQGTVYSGHGRGNFVGPALVRNTVRAIESFTEDVKKRGGTAGQEILNVSKISASELLRGVLDLEEGAQLWQVARVRFIDTIPVGLHDSYVVLPADASLDAQELLDTGSLYALLQRKYGFSPAEAIESLYAQPANSRDAKLLNAKPRCSLLVCERITLSDRRVPIEFCVMKYAPSYRYRNRVVAT
jgi:GntR family transcriptional regulator